MASDEDPASTEDFKQGDCSLCGGYGAANARTHKPVSCLACGVESKGLVLVVLDGEVEQDAQKGGLRLIQGGEP